MIKRPLCGNTRWRIERFGFDGEKCENDLPDCTPNPCLNGATCLEGVGAEFMCE